MKSASETRKPYRGTVRGLIIALDVGTTFSGVSYAILEPGEVPKIHGVTRFPGQEHVAGDSKIPTIIWYDRDGQVAAAGAEAERESVLAAAEDFGYAKAELFKLRLRPRAMKLHMNGMSLPSLPPNKSPVDVFADFLAYLFRCTRAFIEDTHAAGPALWAQVTTTGHGIQFVLSHPNGWEGAQQSKMRRAAVRAGLIPDTDHGRAQIKFVTEGEASLHACVLNGLANDVLSNPSGHGFVVADAGGGTLDISSYAIRGASPLVIEEIAPPDCIFAGSVFVSRRAHAYFAHKLANSRYGTGDSLDHITRRFDETTKRLFRDAREPQYVAFGSPLDKDAAVGIRSGQLKLTGEEVAELFEPSIRAAVSAIQAQVEASRGVVKSVWLVGGFAASPWLFAQLTERLSRLGIAVSRPDTQTSKAVADGAVGFYCDHHVSARMAKFMYGVEYLREFDAGDPDHMSRKDRLCELPSGPKLLLDAFDCILARGVKVKESTVFSRKYCTELTSLSTLSVFEVEIWCYRGGNVVPKWIERDQDAFSTLCLVRADLSPLTETAQPKSGKSGKKFWTIVFSIEIHFGLTEFKARIKWVDNEKVIKYGPASIVYAEAGTRASEQEHDVQEDTGTVTPSRHGTSRAASTSHSRPQGSRSISASETSSSRISSASSQTHASGERPSASRASSYASRSMAPSAREVPSRAPSNYSSSQASYDQEQPPLSRAGSSHTSRVPSRTPSAVSHASSHAPSHSQTHEESRYTTAPSVVPSAAPSAAGTHKTSRPRKESIKSVAFSDVGRAKEVPRSTNEWANAFGRPPPPEEMAQSNSYSETIASNLESVWGDGGESVGPSVSQRVSRAPSSVNPQSTYSRRREREIPMPVQMPSASQAASAHESRSAHSRTSTEQTPEQGYTPDAYTPEQGHTPKQSVHDLSAHGYDEHEQGSHHSTVPPSQFNNGQEYWGAGGHDQASVRGRHIPGGFGDDDNSTALATPAHMTPSHEFPVHVPPMAGGDPSLDDILAGVPPSAVGTGGGMFGGGWGAGANNSQSMLTDVLSTNPSAVGAGGAGATGGWLGGAAALAQNFLSTPSVSKNPSAEHSMLPSPKSHAASLAPTAMYEPPAPTVVAESFVTAATSKKDKKGKKGRKEVEPIPESIPEVYVEPTPEPEVQSAAPAPEEDDWASGVGAKGKKVKKAKETKKAASTFQWEEPEAAPAPAPILEEPPRAPSPPPETVVEEPKAEDDWLAPVSAKKPIKKPKKNQPFTWGAEESEEAPIVPADPEPVAAAPDDWFGGSTVAGKGKKGDELFGSTVGGKKGADMFSFDNPVTEPVVVAPAMSEAATSPAATEEAGADDWFGGGAAKKGKKGKKASPFAWEEPAPEAAPEPEPVAPATTIPEIKEEEAIPGGLDDIPGGLGGSSVFGPTATQVPRNPSANSTSGQEAGGWGLGKVTKKAGGIFGWGGGWGGTNDQAEEPVIPAREPTPPPPPPPAPEPEPEPAPVVETKMEEPEDDWFGASAKAKKGKKASVAPSVASTAVPVAAPAIISPVVTAPVTPAAEEKTEADDWFASAKKRKDKKKDGTDEPAPAPAAAPPPPVPEPERKVEDLFAAEPATAVTPAAEEEEDWFKSTAAPVKKGKKVKKGAVAEESEVPSTDAERKPEQSAAPAAAVPPPTAAPGDDWGLPGATKKKGKKGKK